MSKKTNEVKNVKKSKPARNCGCGCGGQTKGGEFLIGHDAKLKSQLIKSYRGATGKREKNNIAKKFQERNWEKFIPCCNKKEFAEVTK